MKKYFIYAVSALALAGCSSDDFLGGQPSPTKLTDSNVINFSGASSATTRGVLNGTTEPTAAYKLGEKFFVYGTKQTTNTEKADGTDEQTVYMNYLVVWNGQTNTTVSNTAGWEYVGVTNNYTSAVTPTVGTTQTIKYWDYSAPSYVFYACSALETDLTGDKVKIEKITKATGTGATVYDKGYKVTLKEGADVSKLYFSDRKVLTKASDNGNEHGVDNKYGGEVNLTFRNSMTKVRVAFYETIPGYKVTINNFYKTENTQNTQSTAVTDRFVADLTNTPLVIDPTNGTNYIVTYYGSGHQLENQPKMVPETSNTTNVLTLGKGLAANTDISTEKSTPTYDQTAGAYTWFMPQTENTSNLKLKVDYTLTSTDGSNEAIKVKGATAVVPAELLRWRPNYAYTYLFKISANTNGSTGGTTDPAGLYPITFDASVVETADGNAEYITTVSEASITTFAVKDKKYVHDANEYTAGSDIYATVMESGNLQTLSSTNIKVYSITTGSVPTGVEVTEAQVAEWVANTKTSYYTNYTIDDGNFVTSVLSEDGKTITLGNSATALKLASIDAGTYAIEYTNNTNPWTGSYDKVYKVITVQ